jgi:hypothetical protein
MCRYWDNVLTNPDEYFQDPLHFVEQKECTPDLGLNTSLQCLQGFSEKTPAWFHPTMVIPLLRLALQ